MHSFWWSYFDVQTESQICHETQHEIYTLFCVFCSNEKTLNKQYTTEISLILNTLWLTFLHKAFLSLTQGVRISYANFFVPVSLGRLFRAFIWPSVLYLTVYQPKLIMNELRLRESKLSNNNRRHIAKSQLLNKTAILNGNVFYSCWAILLKVQETQRESRQDEPLSPYK